MNPWKHDLNRIEQLIQSVSEARTSAGEAQLAQIETLERLINLKKQVLEWHAEQEPRTVFDVQFYFDKYPDLKKEFGNDAAKAERHWRECGLKEGRQGSASFDVSYYLSAHPDLVEAFGENNYTAALNHWLNHGIKEGRMGVGIS